MATNVVVQIEIREKGAGKAAKQVKGIGINAKTAAIAVTGLVAALGLIAGIRGLARIAGDAIDAAAAFEGYEVQLTALLGSQEEANKALDNFVTLSSKTPFAVAQVVQGATSLAAAALGNRQRLEELVETAANLAAVSGLSFSEAAENLARSLSAGIGAADLFREKGVRALIESIGGIPDATKLSAAELDKAFQDIFGSDGGTFGKAAEDLSLTLGGALSNIGDAADNTRRELGKAFSPVVINAARNVFIPFLQNLQTLVSDNSDAITRFAAGALSSLINAFILAADVGLNFANAGASIQSFIVTLTGSMFEASLQVKEFNVALTRGLDFFGLAPKVGEASLAAQERQLVLARAAVQAVADDVGDANRKTSEFQAGIAALKRELQGLKAIASQSALTELIVRGSGGPSAEDLVDPNAEKISAKAQRQRLSAAKTLAALTRDTALAALDADERALALIDEKIAQAVELGRITGDQAAAEMLINALIEERINLQKNSESDSTADQLGKAVKGAFNENIKAAFTGDIALAGKGFASSLGAQLRADAESNIAAGLESALKGLGKTLEEPFKAVAGKLGDIFGASFEGLSEEMGAALTAGLQFAASLALDAIIGGGGNSSSSSASLSRSVVDSTQAFRGIVTGPREIAIAQVGDSIETAIDPMIQEQGIANIILGQIRDRLSGGTGGTSPSQVASADSLAFNPPS